MLFVFAIFLGLGWAQRPSNASTCDYYAEQLYGANNSETQLQLIQGIVALAFGGHFNLSNISTDITGIFNPGTYQNLSVNLQPWFDGTLESTNLNDAAIGINWLDGGGLDPLYRYLSGATPSIVITNTTNEYRLFSHFFVAHSHLFGCSNPPPADSSASLNLAYVHKFMNLNYTDIAHFIDQLIKATAHYGFSDQDAQTFSNNLNTDYNVRCSPPVNGQPLSLCQADSCPLAEPNPDCAAYVNLTADGIPSGSVSSQTSAPSSSTSSLSSSSTSSSAPASSTSSAIAQTSAAAISSTPAAVLSAGAIAGIAIGGAAVLVLLAAVIILVLKRRTPGAAPTSFNSEPITKWQQNQTASEIGSTGYGGSPDMSIRSPDMSIRSPVEIGGPEQREQAWGRLG